MCCNWYSITENQIQKEYSDKHHFHRWICAQHSTVFIRSVELKNTYTEFFCTFLMYSIKSTNLPLSPTVLPVHLRTVATKCPWEVHGDTNYPWSTTAVQIHHQRAQVTYGIFNTVTDHDHSRDRYYRIITFQTRQRALSALTSHPTILFTSRATNVVEITYEKMEEMPPKSSSKVSTYCYDTDVRASTHLRIVTDSATSRRNSCTRLIHFTWWYYYSYTLHNL
jgi:hypothetical protein